MRQTCRIVINHLFGKRGHSGILGSITHRFLKVVCGFLNIVNDCRFTDKRPETSQTQETGLNMRASSLRQHWSQGQCNIVDDRKLVLVINNDKNKQRWVHSRHSLEQDSNK